MTKHFISLVMTLAVTSRIVDLAGAYRLTSGRYGGVKHGGVRHGSFNGCDNGLVDIHVDWDPSDKEVFACRSRDAEGKVEYRPKGDHKVKAEECTLEADEPIHKCLPEPITYSSALPTSGKHRPVWPTYGEYEYIPVQRWLHALEHGAVVFLYHPCADRGDVDVVRRVARGCLRRHIISPYPAIPKGFNFALLAWKCKLVFQTPDVAEMVAFVKQHARHGPEDYYQNGGYKEGLLKPSEIVSDLNDTIICPTSLERNLLSQKVKESPFQSDGQVIDIGEAKVINRFEPLNSVFPNKESFSSDLKNGFQLLKKEERQLESDLKKSKERLAEIRQTMGGQ